jgi:hypothetical protein
MKNNTPNSITCKQQQQQKKKKKKKKQKHEESKCGSSKVHDHQLSPLLVFFLPIHPSTQKIIY